MFIGKINQNLLILKPAREWADVEADQIPEEILDLISQRQNDMLAIQDYLTKVYVPLRQTGAADVSNVEVPQCLLEAVSRPKSTSTSRKKKSSSSTKKKAMNSGSPSEKDVGSA